MLKRFYKRVPPKKVFFAADIQVRTYACGDAVQEDLCQWLRYYREKQEKDLRRCILFAQETPEGDPYEIGGPLQSKPRPAHPASVLPPLVLDSVTYEVLPDGCVTTDGHPTALRVGTELTAWAIADIPCDSRNVRLLLVIGKPHKQHHVTRLTAYEIGKLGPTGIKVDDIDLPNALGVTASVVALGSHIFTVYNGRLDYHYFNAQTGILEPVSIGADCDNSQNPWCRSVDRTFSVTASGDVYWISDGCIFGIPVGHPRRLIRIPLDARAELLGIRANGNVLQIYTRDKNTGREAMLRYTNENDHRKTQPIPSGARSTD